MSIYIFVHWQGIRCVLDTNTDTIPVWIIVHSELSSYLLITPVSHLFDPEKYLPYMESQNLLLDN